MTHQDKGVSSFWKVGGGDTERGSEATELVRGEGVSPSHGKGLFEYLPSKIDILMHCVAEIKPSVLCC